MPYEYVLTFCRWAVGITFAVSAGGKALNLGAFREAILDFGVLSRRLSGPAATTFFAAEVLVVALMVLGGIGLPVGFALGGILLIIFSAALATALRESIEVNCNCFGRAERRVSWYDVARNAILVVCAGVGLWAYEAFPQQVSPKIGAVLLLSLMASCFVVIVTNLEDIVETLRRPYTVD